MEALFFTALGRYFERVSNEHDVGDAGARVQTTGSPRAQSRRPKVSGLPLEASNPQILKLACWRLHPGLHSTGLASAVSADLLASVPLSSLAPSRLQRRLSVTALRVYSPAAAAFCVLSSLPLWYD